MSIIFQISSVYVQLHYLKFIISALKLQITIKNRNDIRQNIVSFVKHPYIYNCCRFLFAQHQALIGVQKMFDGHVSETIIKTSIVVLFPR